MFSLFFILLIMTINLFFYGLFVGFSRERAGHMLYQLHFMSISGYKSIKIQVFIFHLEKL